jgi:YHS domain-containing protein
MPDVPLPGGISPTERVVHDGLSGFALNGFDPVSFFLSDKPEAGNARFELIWGGVAWRFASSANRAAFLDNPEIYAPRFGGHDPEAVARGIPVEGSEQYFLVTEAGLYLFHDPRSRELVRKDPAILSRAAARWKDVEASLVSR